jgi:regulator of protease activity HflC (stomatin/prohibitin superfamily)
MMESLLIFLLVIIVFFVVIFAATSFRVVRQSTVGIVERLGQFQEPVRQAGLTWITPFIERIILVDLREQVMPLPPQPVITKDNVTMNIDAVIYFQVTDPFRATYEVADLFGAVEKLALTTMRNIIGNMTLDQTLSSRDTINAELQHVLDDATTKLGLKVNRVELKDISPPRDIEEAMQKQMRAEREKRSVILLAEGEKQSAILKAEGEKEAAVLQAQGDKEAQIERAEGDRQSAILRAKGQAESIRLVQQAEADMINKVFTSIKDADPTVEVLQVRYLEALQRVADGKATTLLLPYESSAFMGSLAGAVSTLKKMDQGDGPHRSIG